MTGAAVVPGCLSCNSTKSEYGGIENGGLSAIGALSIKICTNAIRCRRTMPLRLRQDSCRLRPSRLPRRV